MMWQPNGGRLYVYPPPAENWSETNVGQQPALRSRPGEEGSTVYSLCLWVLVTSKNINPPKVPHAASFE